MKKKKGTFYTHFWNVFTRIYFLLWNPLKATILKSEVLEFTSSGSTAYLKFWIMNEKRRKSITCLPFLISFFYIHCYESISFCKIFLKSSVKTSSSKIYIFRPCNTLEISKLCEIDFLTLFSLLFLILDCWIYALHDV